MLFLSALIAPLTFVRPRAGIFLLAFLLAFMPRYLGLGVGDAGFALTPRRMAIVAGMLGLLAVVALRPDILRRAVAIGLRNKFIVLLVLSLYVVKLLATVANSGVGVNIFYVFDDFVVSLVPAIGVLMLVRSERDEALLITIIVMAMIFSAMLAAIETAKGDVLLQGFVSVSVEEAGRGGLMGLMRDEAYRAKALFDNPLLLAEFVCIAWPWAIYLWMSGRHELQRWAGLVGCMVAPLAIFLAHTRSGWLVFVLGCAAYLVLRVWDRSSRVARWPIAFSTVTAVAAAGALAVNVVVDLVRNAAAGAVGVASIVERLEQFVVVAIAWRDSPLLGYGMTRNFGQDLDFLNHIDNYWLRLMLEGGAVLFVLFMLLAVRVIMATARERTSAPTLECRLFMTAAIVSLGSFLAYKLFLSMPTNNVYFFIVVALVMRRIYWLQKVRHHARLALSQ